MRAGKLRTPIIIEQPTQTTGTNGEITNAWAQFAMVWAEPKVLTERSHTREEFEAGQVNAYARFNFHVRGIAGITTDMRVTVDGLILDIEAVIPVALLGEEVVLHCRERQFDVKDY